MPPSYVSKPGTFGHKQSLISAINIIIDDDVVVAVVVFIHIQLAQFNMKREEDARCVSVYMCACVCVCVWRACLLNKSCLAKLLIQFGN